MTDPILTEVSDFLGRYIFMGDDEKLIVALWVLHSWQFSESCTTPNVTPYLYVNSPQKGSGKTLVIDTLELLVRNPARATDMSESTLFRLIASVQPTLMLDEVDTVFGGGAKHEGLRGAINGGYRRGGHVWRTDGLEPVKFSTFGAKLLAGIQNMQLPDTIRDRCIPIELRRATREELDTIQPLYHYEIEDEVEELCNRVHAWSIGVENRCRDYRPEVMRELSPRQWEISRELVSMAHLCGCERQVREALSRILTASPETTTIEQDLLKLCKDAFESEQGFTKMTGADLLAYLGERDPRFAGLSGKGLAVKLQPFGVKATTIRIGNATHRGYHRETFIDAWKRYL
jgi:hypothetical protein